MKVTIIGAGAYSIALSFMFYENTRNITIYSKVPEEIEVLKKYRKNDNYLKDIKIYDDIKLTTNLKDALDNTDLIVIGVATKFVGSITREIKEYYKNQPILIASKGIDQNSLLFVSSIVKSIIKTDKIAVISGPTFAIHLAMKETCGLSIASTDNQTMDFIENLLANKYLKLRKTNDVLGVEICGSIKNVLAIAAGILDGINASDSTKAMFLTESLNDIRYLIQKLGGDGNTIMSYAGFGDFLLTCTSTSSRNFSFGKLIGKQTNKKEIDNYLDNNTIEGVYTLKALEDLLEKERIDLPIIGLIHDIIFKDKSPKDILLFLKNKK